MTLLARIFRRKPKPTPIAWSGKLHAVDQPWPKPLTEDDLDRAVKRLRLP